MIERQVYSGCDCDGPCDCERCHLCTVTVLDDGTLSLHTPNGWLLYRASLEHWALSMLYTSWGPGLDPAPPGTRVVTAIYPDGKRTIEMVPDG